MDFSALETLIKVTTPFYVVIILFEIIISNWQGQKFYTVKDTLTNIYLTSLNAGLDIVFRGVSIGVLYWFWLHRIVDIQPAWIYWLFLFVAEDFLYYVIHVVDHYVRFFWAVHVTHHSSEHYNLTTGFRSSVFQPLYRFVYFIPLAILGFTPADIAFMYSATQIYGILVHTEYNVRLGLLEWILVTPSHHRVHHASNIEYLDKNMGMCLIIWDRIFGTYQAEEPHIQVKYGLTYPLEDRGPFNIVFHEWKSIANDVWNAKGLKNKLMYIMQPPGWSPDGSTKTSNQLRAEKNTALSI